MRLIDADRLKEVFDRNVVSAGVWNEIIDNQPTAYDVEKVSEELEQRAIQQDKIALGISVNAEAERWGHFKMAEAYRQGVLLVKGGLDE